MSNAGTDRAQTSRSAFKSLAFPRKAGAVVDEHFMLRGLESRQTLGQRLRTINRFAGKNPITRSTLNRLTQASLPERFEKTNRSGDIAGLGEAFIEVFYRDVAVRRMMTMEFRLRSADMNRRSSSEALYLLPQAMRMVEEFEANPSATTEFRIALTSLKIQVLLYLSRDPYITDEVKLGHLLDARCCAEKSADDCMRVVRRIDDDFGLGFQAVRIECNAYHVENELEPLAQKLKRHLPSGPLDRSKKSVARRITKDEDIYRSIKKITEKFGDPRLPINPAEAAGFINEHHRAASLLRLSMTADGYGGNVQDWAPKWLPERYLAETRDLQEAIRIIGSRSE